MHSFHQSRGRIVFEVLCALTVSASCAGAWLQTGASALLPAALAAAIYGLWHLTDMAGRSASVAAEAADVAPAVAGHGDLLAHTSTDDPVRRVEEAPRPEAVEQKPRPAPKAKRPKRKKPAARVEAADLQIVELASDEAVAPAVLGIAEEHHAPIEPLFEPQPLVRQQRAVFGRKAG